MSLQWERFAGNTAIFAVRMSLYDDPHQGQGAEPATSSSWGALQIWIDGVNICAHTDQGETISASHWYLLPILEWLVSAWDPLLHEERLPLERFMTASSYSTSPVVDFDSDEYWDQEEKRYAWNQRHGLRAASDGGLLPDLKIRRFREKIEFSWARSPIAGADDIEWQAPLGQAYLDPDTVASVLFEVVTAAADRLVAVRPQSDRLRTLQAQVELIKDLGKEEERTAWLASLGQTSQTVIRRWQNLIANAIATASSDAVRATFRPSTASPLVVTGSSQAALLFGSASPTLTDDDAFLLTQRILQAYTEESKDDLDGLLAEEPIHTSSQPWAQGYNLASDLLEEQPGIIVDGRVNLEGFLDSHGVSVSDIDLADQNLRAVSFGGRSHQPTILVNSSWTGNRSVGGRRFTLAHELGHLLFDRSYGTALAVASGPWAPTALEQRANAFAAMLLMPLQVLKVIDSAISFRQAKRDAILSAAQKIGVSYLALVEHLYNVGLVNESRRAELRHNDYE